MAFNVLLSSEKHLFQNVARISATNSKCGDLLTQKKLIHTTETNKDSSNKLNLITSTSKRGTGGRSSFSGQVVTVFGSTGRIARNIINRLGKEGFNVVCPYRGDDYDVRTLKLAGDLGQIQLLPFHLRDEDSIRRAVKHSNIVINTIGTNWETSNFKYEDVHIEGAKRLAKISRESGVERFIHFSALNASPNPQRIVSSSGSKFLKTKYEGELAVQSEFPNSVIIRPSVTYGEEDRFLMYYIHPHRRTPFHLPLWRRGEYTVKMPVHQSDVASGIMKIVNDPTIFARTYDFVGPDKYLLVELVDYILKVVRRNNIKITNMGPYVYFLCWFYSQSPKNKYFNFDVLEREFISDVLTDENARLKDLGVTLKKFEDVVPYHLKIYNRLAYYDEALGEFPDPDPPKPLSDDFHLNFNK